ncbi:MAG: Holliday junction resolvase RuvX [Nitrospirota bacterium]
MRVLGIDIGERRIGIAISDEYQWIANPYSVIDKKIADSYICDILKIVEDNEIEKIVVGLPLKLDGNVGIEGEKAIKFREEIKEESDIPVILWDERFSSISANRILLDADMSRKKRKKVIDKMAAAIILQSYLDSEQNKSGK